MIEEFSWRVYLVNLGTNVIINFNMQKINNQYVKTYIIFINFEINSTMKNAILFFLLLVNFNLSAQSFLPFNSSSHKLFRDDIGNTYSMFIQHTEGISGDSLYIPALNVDGNMFYSDSCIFWGGGCHKQNVPGWLGEKIISNNTGNYIFYQNNDDSLIFNFNTNVLDTNLVFQNSTEKLKMSFDNSAVLSILGFTDSVNYYDLYHTDLNGNPINSALNQFQICVGKNLGLINFFKIDNFPTQVTTLILLGNQNPDIGYYRISNEILYDYAVGDEFQYVKNSGHSNPSWGVTDYSLIVKHSILNKTQTTDTLIYTVAQQTINLLTSSLILDTIFLRYPKNQDIAGIPYEIFDGYNYKTFKQTEICGNNYWELSSVNEPYNLAYCAIDTCWGGIDTQGPAATITVKNAIGLGQTLYQDYLFGGNMFTSHYISSSLTYFKKNGQSCGTEQFLETTALINSPLTLKISPNPSQESLNVDFEISQKYSHLKLEVYDMQGQLLLIRDLPNEAIQSNHSKIDLSTFNSGLYLLKLELDGKLVHTAKFIKN